MFKTFRTFFAPVWASLVVIFAPAELVHAFTASLAASTALGFAATFLTTVGTDAGIFAGVISFALLHLAAKLASLHASTARLRQDLEDDSIMTVETPRPLSPTPLLSTQEVDQIAKYKVDNDRLKADWDRAFGPPAPANKPRADLLSYEERDRGR